MWIENSKTRIHFDMHFPEWTEKGVASNFDPEAIAENFIKSKTDSVVLYGKCQYGNFYYNTKIGHKHKGLKDLDLFKEVQQRVKKHGIKVEAYYSVCWDELMAKEHPDWLVMGPNGETDSDEFRWKTLCINSPYRQVVFDHMRDLLEINKPDGIWIDMTIIGTDRCHCEYCQEKFKTTFGRNIPKSKNDADFDKFMQWRYDYIEEFYGELRKLIKSIDPNIDITNNYWGYPYSWAWMGSRAIGALKHADFITGEAYTDWTGLNAPSFFSKFLRGAAAGRPFEAIIGRFHNTWDFTVKPFEQMAFESYSIVANGGMVVMVDEPYYDGSTDREIYGMFGSIFGEIEKRSTYLHGKPLKYAAILHSQSTKDLYNDYGNSDFIRSIAGSYKMLRDLHLPIDFIFDEDIENDDLNDYKVIVMPDVAVVTVDMMKRLHDFTANGGLLICSGPTALFEANANRLENSTSLKEFFDIEVEGLSEFSLSYMKYLNNELMEEANLDRPYLVKGKYVKYKNYPRGTVAAQIVNPICETDKVTFYHNNLPSPHIITDYPALLFKTVGKGHIACFAQPVFAQYAKQSQAELRMSVKAVIDKMGEKAQVEYNCPNRIDVAADMKDGKLIIHLINPNPGMTVCCGYMDPYESAYPRTLEYMDEIIPVYDLKIIIQSDTVSHVESIGENSKIKWSKSNGKTVITLDQLKLWETLVVTI